MMRLTSLTTTILLVAAMAVCLGATLGCDGPADGAVFPATAEFHGDGAGEADQQKAALIADLEAAQVSIDIAISTLEDAEIAQALVDARQRGVSVRVVADEDSQGAAGLTTLESNEITPEWGDGALEYLPDPTLGVVLGQCQESEARRYTVCSRGQDQGQMVRPGHYNLMSHNFAVIDGDVVWNFPAFDGASRNWIGWRVKSSKLAYDFAREFQQMHGGVFSTTLSIYNGPLKSDTNYNVRYLTDKGMFKVWFNPQERLMKTVIDEVYKARSSVWVMSDTLSNSHLIDALEYKASNGFDVRILVHPDHQATSDPKDRIDAMGARYAPADYDSLSTLIVIDAEVDREGRKWGRHIMGMSHALLRGSPFEVEYDEPNDKVFIYPSDLFADGNLWLIDEKGANVHDFEVNDIFETQWRQMWQAAQ